MTNSMKVSWSSVGDPNRWDAGNSFYFPFAEQFLKYCPWLAVRAFYVIIKIQGLLKHGPKPNIK